MDKNYIISIIPFLKDVFRNRSNQLNNQINNLEYVSFQTIILFILSVYKFLYSLTFEFDSTGALLVLKESKEQAT